MNNKKKFLLYDLLPLLVFMGIIIFMSAQKNIETNTYIPDNILKNTAHFVEYFILTLLVYRVLRYFNNKSVLLTILVVTLFALSDELHQYFVPTRTASIYDFLIDITAMVVSILVYRWYIKKMN